MNQQAALAVIRFGMGAGPDEIDRARVDPKGYVTAQIGQRPLVADLPNTKARAALFRQYREKRNQAKRGEAQLDETDLKAFQQDLRGTVREEVEARLMAGVRAEHPFSERLARFWANHFTVSARKGAVAPIAGAFEREAIRPHLFGRFEDLLLAAEGHPAMILYLDNHLSMGPNSPVGRRRGRGLNENLAREILELHTLGVDGGYGQTDVEGLAKLLTGWTVAPPRRFPDKAGEFLFLDPLHEPGRHQMLGRRYPADGSAAARAALIDLARHPATARHIARKLAVHFIADDPPPRLVAALERRFVDTGGDLSAVYQTLLDQDAAWDPVLAKVKPPEDYLTAILRLVAAETVPADRVLGMMRAMGQMPMSAPGPDGWPDSAEAWANPDGLMRRVEFAQLIGERLAGGADPRRLARQAFGDLMSPATEQAVARAADAAQGTALALLAPEMMRR